MNAINKLKTDLEGTQGLLAQKSTELAQEKLRTKAKEKRGFRSKVRESFWFCITFWQTCQTDEKEYCDQAIDAKPVITNEAESQVSNFATITNFYLLIYFK